MIEQNENIERLNPDGFTTMANVAKLYDVSTSTLRLRLGRSVRRKRATVAIWWLVW